MMSKELTVDSSIQSPKRSSVDITYPRIRIISALGTLCALFLDANKELGQSPLKDSTQKEPRLQLMFPLLSKK